MNIKDFNLENLNGAYNRVMGRIDTTKYIADDNGNVSIKLPLKELPIKIITSYIGYGSLEMKINDSLSKDINIVLKNFPPAYFRAGDKQTFNIKFMEKNSFFIKSLFYDEWLPFIRID